MGTNQTPEPAVCGKCKGDVYHDGLNWRHTENDRPLRECPKPSEQTLAVELAKAWHAALLKNPQCVAWTWDELNDEHRAWKVAAAHELIATGWQRRVES